MGERIQPGKGHIAYGNEVISYVYRPPKTETTQGRVILTAGLGDEVDENDEGIQLFAANGWDTLKIAGPHGDGTPRLPNRRIADIPERSVNAVWMAYDHVFSGVNNSNSPVPTVIYGPSMGGRTALLAARQRTADVSAVIVANPAYCPPGSNLIDRTRRYLLSGVESFRTGSADFKKGSINTLKRLLSSPVASFRLGATALEQDLPEIVFELAENDVRTVFLLGESDTVFDATETSTHFLTYFDLRHSEKVKQNLPSFRSLDTMKPDVQVLRGGHYLDNYAEIGLKGIKSALGWGEQERGLLGITLFDATGKV